MCDLLCWEAVPLAAREHLHKPLLMRSVLPLSFLSAVPVQGRFTLKIALPFRVLWTEVRVAQMLSVFISLGFIRKSVCRSLPCALVSAWLPLLSPRQIAVRAYVLMCSWLPSFLCSFSE